MLWDELLAFQGLDEKDLTKFVIVAEYINALKRFGKLDSAVKHTQRYKFSVFEGKMRSGARKSKVDFFEKV